MKKLLTILLLAAAPVFAASYTVNTNAAQDARAARELASLNKVTCANVGLGANCTQVAVRIAYCAQETAIPKGTVPCTVDGRSSNEIRVFSGVGDYFDRYVIDSNDRIIKARQKDEDAAAWAAWLTSATQAQKDAVCASAGLPAGCFP